MNPNAFENLAEMMDQWDKDKKRLAAAEELLREAQRYLRPELDVRIASFLSMSGKTNEGSGG